MVLGSGACFLMSEAKKVSNYERIVAIKEFIRHQKSISRTLYKHFNWHSFWLTQELEGI